MTERVDVDDFLAHYGIPGMKWGKRKTRDKSGDGKAAEKLTPEQKAKLKKAAVIVGTAAAVAVLAVGAVYVSKRMNSPVPKDHTPSSKTKTFVEDKLKEPIGVIHASKPKHQGFKFFEKGGLDEPLVEYDKAGFNGEADRQFFSRYGDNKEKIAARFLDLEGRNDRAGRPVIHEVILPESLAKGVKDLDGAISKVWPLIKDAYAAEYEVKLY